MKEQCFQDEAGAVPCVADDTVTLFRNYKPLSINWNGPVSEAVEVIAKCNGILRNWHSDEQDDQPIIVETRPN